MKKAKQYATEFNANPTTETLTAICNSFCSEINELQDQRRVKTNAGMLSILDEQDRKWRAFARRVNGIREDGFAKLIKLIHPHVYEIWRERDA